MTTRKFDSNYEALKKRININEKMSSRDINSWIIEHLQLSKNQNILDLGCGNGKQLIPIIKQTENSGFYSGVDISNEALIDLKDKLKQLNISERVELLKMDIDNISPTLRENSVDRILASYSLYYTKKTSEIIKTLWSLLKEKGMLFYCGPTNQNNIELKLFHYHLKNEEVKLDSFASEFMENISLEYVKKYFTKHEIYYFENPISFDSADSLYSYWSSYNLFDELIDRDFRNAAEKYFLDNKYFISVKRVIGIKCYK